MKKETKTKRIIAFILTGIMIISLIPVFSMNVRAEETMEDEINTDMSNADVFSKARAETNNYNLSMNKKTFDKIAVGRCNTGYITDGNTYISFGNETIGINEDDGVNKTEASYLTLPDGKVCADVEKGFFHTVILTTDGTVYTFGDNEYGQLGNGTTDDSDVLIDITGRITDGTEKIVQISANGYHTLALTDCGNLYGWGRNNYSQLYYEAYVEADVFLTPTLIYQFPEKIDIIETGGYSSYALTTTGRLYGWGFNGYGNLGDGSTIRALIPTYVWSLDGQIAKFSAGKQHAVAMTTDGKVYAWGRNDHKQIYDSDEPYYMYPYELAPDDFYDYTLLDVKAGGNTTCVITDMDIFLLGDNQYCQLGKVSSANSNRISNMMESDITDYGKCEIALGESHTVIITDKQKVYTFGKNNHGQLAQGELSKCNTYQNVTDKFLITDVGFSDRQADTLHIYELENPVYVPIPYNIEQTYSLISGISEKFRFYSGDNSVVTVDEDTGSIVDIKKVGVTNIYAVWVENERLINRDFNNDIHSEYIIKYPVVIYSNTTHISSGKMHSTYFSDDGNLNVWGYNKYGQLGIERVNDRLSPIELTYLFDRKIISAKNGYHHTIVLTEDGSVYSFGYNDCGQLGDGSTTDRNIPVLISGFDSPVVKIEAAARQTFAITKNGKVYAWGRNNYGQLGDGTNTDKYIPTDITGQFGAEKIKEIISGDYSAYALTTTGKVYSWGFGSRGNIGDGTVAAKNIPTDISSMFGENKIVKVSAGSQHAIALTDQLELYGWGYNNCSQLGDNLSTIISIPQKITDETVINIFADESNIGYITLDGKVYLMGANTDGQLGSAEAISSNEISAFFEKSIRNIAFGEKHTVIFTENGHVYTIGGNNHGQLGKGDNESTNEFTDITSLFNRNRFAITGEIKGEYTFPVEDSEEYIITVNLRDVIPVNNEILIRYDVNNLILTDSCIFTADKELKTGKVKNTDLTILAVDEANGKIRFKYNAGEYNNIYYTGMVNALKFKAKKRGITYAIVELIEVNNEEDE